MLPLEPFQAYQRQPDQYTLLFARITPGASVTAVQARIDRDFPQLATIRTLQQFGRADRSLSLILAADRGATVLAIIIGAIVVMSAMTMSSIERTHLRDHPGRRCRPCPGTRPARLPPPPHRPGLPAAQPAALANEPGLLLADEPTGSLDERSVRLVPGMLARLRAERPAMTVIIVTHDLRVADTADRVIWLRDGRADDRAGRQGSGHGPGSDARMRDA